MTARKTRVLNAQEKFGKNIVDALRDKKIAMNAPVNLKTADGKGTRFASTKKTPGLVLDVIKTNGAKNPRYLMTVSFPGKVKGAVKKTLVTGEFARKAHYVLTKVPKVRKVEIPAEDLALANKAFGF